MLPARRRFLTANEQRDRRTIAMATHGLFGKGAEKHDFGAEENRPHHRPPTVFARRVGRQQRLSPLAI